MKLFRMLPFLLLAAPAFGQVSVPAEEAAAAATYEPRTVQASARTLKGKLIELHFLCRSSVVTDTADGGKTGEVLDSPTTRQKVNVEVPKQAVDWFMHVPTTYSGGPAFTIYARLSIDQFGQPVAKLLGRKLAKDAKGTRLEW
jgi:hypothetical protein